MLMKISKLLVLSALFAVSVNSAKAGVPDGIWTMPEPQGLEFTTFTDDGTHYYLYNPAAKMFFGSGNSWNTQASARVYGYAFWLQEATENGAPEGSYELWNYVNNPERGDVTGDHNVFFDGSSFWVDHGTQAGYTWNFTIVGDAVRFYVVTSPDRFIGWDGTYIDSDDAGSTCSSVLRNLDPAAEGVCVDWKAVTEESYDNFVWGDNYEAYCEGAKIYIASVGLRTALEAAEAVSLECPNALAVYTNTGSTIEEMRDAKNVVNARVALKKAIDAAKAVYVDVTAAEAVLADEGSSIEAVNKAAEDLKDITAVKQALKDLIEECESKGYTETAAAKAVLENTASTKEQVEQATKDLTDAFTEWGKSHATMDNPADMTGMIVNPLYDNNTTTGWEGSKPSLEQHGIWTPEFWNQGSFDHYQTIKELPEGIYMLNLMGFYRDGGHSNEGFERFLAGTNPNNTFLYATVDGVTHETYLQSVYNSGVTEALGVNGEARAESADGHVVYAPNQRESAQFYFDHGKYAKNEVMFNVNAGQDVTIGLKKSTGPSYDWISYNRWTLTYYGNEMDAWQYYVNQTLVNFPEVTIGEDELVTEAYVEAYKAAKEADSNITSKEQAQQLLNGVQTAYDALLKNLELWKKYQSTLELAKSATTDFDGTESAEILNDYLTMDMNEDGGSGMETILEEHSLTNEELEAEIAWLEAKIASAKQEVLELLQPGEDVTRFMQNADFEQCTVNTGTGEAPGWTVKKDVGNVTAGPLGQDNYNLMVSALGKMNYCFESWHSHDFDVYQEVTDAPEGVYVIEAQGFIRCENNGYTRGNEVDPATVPVHLYMNNATDVFPNVYSEIPADLGYSFTTVESWTTEEVGGNLFPNSMGGAAQCFEWGMYKMSTFGLVKKGETMRIGVKGKMKTDDTENWWCIWDNFKLTYQGYEVEYVLPALEEALSKINSEQLMGKDVKEKALALEAQAAEAKASGDGKTMFHLLADIYDVVEEIEASVRLFIQLQETLQKFGEAYGNNFEDAPAGDDVKAAAQALFNTVDNGIMEGSLTDADAEAYIKEMEDMLSKLAVPDVTGASDSNPIDMTSTIKSPSFDEWNEDGDHKNTSNGWNQSGANLGNDAASDGSTVDQKLCYAIEFWQIAFDMFQDIKNLPAGTYMLQVDGWCRNGSNEENYAEWLADENATLAYLYAMDSDSTMYSAPLANLMKGDHSEETCYVTEDGDEVYEMTEVELGEENTLYWLPSTLVSGRSLLDQGKEDGITGTYTNKVVFKLKENDTLRIGVKKNVEKTNSWVVVDDFRLFYYGTDSKQELSGNPLTIENVTVAQPVKVEFFTLDGRKTTGMQKGIFIQKMTLDNGTIVVRKIRK